MLRALSGLLVPPLCVGCGAGCSLGDPLCRECERDLCGSRPFYASLPGRGDEPVWAAAPYSGVARELVAALKFRALLPAAEACAARIASAVPPDLLQGALVPVPPSPRRAQMRGFDPAREIASALARRTGLPLLDCLQRTDGARQASRGREARMRRPPQVRPAAPAAAAVALVDDVWTTGATLSVCARAARQAGAKTVVAITFAHRARGVALGRRSA